MNNNSRHARSQNQATQNHHHNGHMHRSRNTRQPRQGARSSTSSSHHQNSRLAISSHHQNNNSTAHTRQVHHARKTQSQDNCENPLCYSYLVAIVSSILVVTGLYLTLTRLDLRYLYLSLAGFLFVLFGACLYCVGTLKGNQSPTRKFSALPQQFVSSTSSQSNNQHQPPRSTLLLTNRHMMLNDGGSTLNSNSELSVAIDGSEDTSQLIRSSQSNQPPLSTAVSLIPNISQENTRIEGQSSSQNQNQPSNFDFFQAQKSTSSNDPRTAHQVLKSLTDITNEQTKNEQDLIKESFSQPTNNHDQISSTNASKNVRDGINTSVQVNTTDAEQHIGCSSKFISSSSSNQEQSLVAIQAVPQHPKTSEETNIDMDQDNVDSANCVVDNQARIRPTRQGNLRRTLVMGLSGEQEVIEIDEDDIDKMSIMPPPYESLKPRDKI